MQLTGEGAAFHPGNNQGYTLIFRYHSSKDHVVCTDAIAYLFQFLR